MKRKPTATAAMPATIKNVRAAVYTRKSSEEGLDMEFNSLDAQRDACEAYITSQRSEGWVLLPDRYDDGGVSGGTLERPALRRMLADIERGLVDVVVVYKIDRLSRALMDFAKLVEVFDANNVTFVSVTRGRSAGDTTLVKAVARAFRWRRMMETGRFATLNELAAAEKINSSYVSRLLRLTLLVPDIVEAILDGRQPEQMTLPGLMEPFPVEWERQKGSPLPSPLALVGGPNRSVYSDVAESFIRNESAAARLCGTGPASFPREPASAKGTATCNAHGRRVLRGPIAKFGYLARLAGAESRH